ncbi:MAG: hypothetical protein IPP89_00540 [Saprospiraceae bacterium]|nr:hypothetical protein [Candidatus Brachybacter algidus]MBL0117496.1 hypothetical protein [Candidatus Brachybacter algidus]
MLELAKVWRANHPGFSARTLFYSILNQGIYLGVGINRFERWVDIIYGQMEHGILFFASKMCNQFILCLLPSKNMKAEQAVASLKDALA